MSLSLPSQVSVASGSICSYFLLIEVWLGQSFPSNPRKGRAAVAPRGCEAAAKALNTEEHRQTGQAPGDQEDSRLASCECSESSCPALLESKRSETFNPGTPPVFFTGWLSPRPSGQMESGESRGKQAALRVLRLLERAAHGGAHRNVPALCFDRKLLIRRS